MVGLTILIYSMDVMQLADRVDGMGVKNVM